MNSKTRAKEDGVLCRDGCGEYGDANLEYVCVKCYEDRMFLKTLKESDFEAADNSEEALKGRLDPSNESMASQARKKSTLLRQKSSETLDVSLTSSSNKVQAHLPKQLSGTNPFDEAKTPSVMKEFLEREREQNDHALIEYEIKAYVQFHHRRKICTSQLRKYMIASNRGKVLDPKIWSKYHLSAPHFEFDSTRNGFAQAATRGTDPLLPIPPGMQTQSKSKATFEKEREEQKMETHAFEELAISAVKDEKNVEVLSLDKLQQSPVSDLNLTAVNDMEATQAKMDRTKDEPSSRINKVLSGGESIPMEQQEERVKTQTKIKSAALQKKKKKGAKKSSVSTEINTQTPS